jgi:hypothetical protein
MSVTISDNTRETTRATSANVVAPESNEEKAIERREKQVPWGVTTFAELEEAEEALEATQAVTELTWNFNDLLWNILHSDEIDDKAGTIRQLSDEFTDRLEVLTRRDPAKERDLKEFAKAAGDDGLINKVKNAVKKAAGIKTERMSLLIYKDQGGTNRFVGVYSNNFRDDDRPPEIISELSHKKFVALVDSGFVDPPELWLWHEKLLKVGQSEWVAYDDSGFAIAGGYFNEGTEELVEILKQLDDVAMSHGMPKWSIGRDDADKSIIVEHITKEISLLPGWAAANKRTGFIILDEVKGKENEDNMAISQEKRDELASKWNISPDLLDALERQNSKEAIEATNAGVEHKEADTEVAEEVAEEAADETSAEEDVANATLQVDVSVNDEVARALEETMKGVITLSERLKDVEAAVKELSKSDAEKISQKQAATPLASMSELMNLSVLGKDETRVDGRTKFGKDAPLEREPEIEQRTGIPFIDKFITNADKPERS